MPLTVFTPGTLTLGAIGGGTANPHLYPNLAYPSATTYPGVYSTGGSGVSVLTLTVKTPGAI